jgi:hypothetical protein
VPCVAETKVGLGHAIPAIFGKGDSRATIGVVSWRTRGLPPTPTWRLAGVLLVLGVGTASGAARAVDAGPADASGPLAADAARAAKETARRDGNAMYQAFHDGDLEPFAAYTYPGLLKLFGGKQKMIATVASRPWRGGSPQHGA